MFANVILPDVPVDQMRGLFSLLSLIANSQSQTAADFLTRLSAEKDAAVEAAKQAATDRAAAEALHREMPDITARQVVLIERERILAEGQADLARRESEHRSRLQSLAALASAIKLPAA